MRSSLGSTLTEPHIFRRLNLSAGRRAVDELTMLGLQESLLDVGADIRELVDVTGNGILHELVSIASCLHGEVLQLFFNVRSEVRLRNVSAGRVRTAVNWPDLLPAVGDEDTADGG